jgi:uncharacterized protein
LRRNPEASGAATSENIRWLSLHFPRSSLPDKYSSLQFDTEFSLSDRTEEKAMEPSKIIELNLSDKLLELILLPTEKCNFRCVYCYESFKVGRMKRSVIEGVKALLRHRAPNLTELKIEWFGGEPLVAKDIVLEISETAAELARQHPHLVYISAVTTNGYLLTPDLARSLVSSGVKSYQISIDGPREFHDKTRLRADGAGTFDRLWSNLLALRETDLDFKINLRLHLTPENLEAMPAFVQTLVETFDDPRFALFFKEINHLGGPNDGNIEVLRGRSQSVMAELQNIVRARSRFITSNGAEGVNSEKADPTEICYAARANSFLIRPNGNVGKCTVWIEDERNHVGNILEDGRLIINPAKLQPWMRGLAALDMSVMHCPAANWPALQTLQPVAVPETRAA